MAEEASAVGQDNEDNVKLTDYFLEGWKHFDELEQTNLAANSLEFQRKVKTNMECFENATKIVSSIGMFSSNELLDEVSTDSLQYLLLPFFLGKLSLKLNQDDRLEILNVAEIYFKDYLQRCSEYELCDPPKTNKSEKDNENKTPNPSNEMAQLMRAANFRNEKIAKFRQKKELEEHIKQMKDGVQNRSVDDEIRREFFIKYLKKSVIDANEELDSLQMEKQMVEMRKMHMSSSTGSSEFNNDLNDLPTYSQRSHNQSHGHSHSHGHNHLHAPPKRKPLQPFIITRDANQKAVFGRGYPSLPIMTVGEFYQQRVNEGIFPDEEKVAKMNQAQAIAAAEDPEIKEEEEKEAIEEQIENDDPEYLARMRRMDEYKDVVRRGDGNRYNRS